MRIVIYHHIVMMYDDDVNKLTLGLKMTLKLFSELTLKPWMKHNDQLILHNFISHGDVVFLCEAKVT